MHQDSLWRQGKFHEKVRASNSDATKTLTLVVDLGEETVVGKLLANEVKLDAEVRDAALRFE